jgi:hypothetical protein
MPLDTCSKQVNPAAETGKKCLLTGLQNSGEASESTDQE